MPLDLAAVLDTRGRRPAAGTSVLLGWAVSSTAGTVTATLPDGSTVTAPKVRSYAEPLENDVVLILKAGAALYCLGTLNGAPVPPIPPDPDEPDAGWEPPMPTAGTVTFRPVSTGTWLGAAWEATTNVSQGDPDGTGPRTGAAFYGTAPSATSLPGPATSATLRLRRNPGGTPGPQPPTLALLAEQARSETTMPTVLDVVTLPPLPMAADTTAALPGTWTTALLDGTATGLGTWIPDPAPALTLAGLAAWGPAFELAITWQQIDTTPTGQPEEP